ncbi:MAG: hypothetical protein AAB453_04465 [Patescibacteria group bacterium]
MSIRKVKVVAVLPVGSGNDGIDTIESIFFYLTPSVHIIVIDDSKNHLTAERLRNIDERISVMEAEGHGIGGGLWTNLARAYKYAVENFEFDVLLRIDTDALIIAKHPENEAIEIFKQDPTIGMLGSYKVDCNGDERSFKISASSLRKESGIRGILNLKRRKLLRDWIKEAKMNNYQVGEHILGGADFQSYSCIKTMSDRGFLDTSLFLDSGISEDFLFSLLTCTSGYRLSDFATGDFPMGLRWQGLPDSPQNLIKRGKKVIHSTKFWKDINQKSIHEFFKQQRDKEKN